jgi:hypothetical protein
LSESEKRDIAKRLENKITNAIEQSIDNPSIASAILGIPIFGEPIYVALSTMQSQIVQRRIQQLVLSLHEEALLIERNKVDFTFFESEEFYDLIRKVIECTFKTHDNSKIRLYARILTRLPLLDNAKFRHNAEDFLSILLELTPADLLLAREVYKQHEDIAERIHSSENESSVELKSGSKIQSNTGLDETDFELAITKLVRAGLIKEVVTTAYGYSGDAYKITHTFRKLIELVEKLE